jgi:hypothetical protein
MQYNTIKIGSYWLTRSGSAVSGSNPACKTSIEGLDALQSNFTGAVQIALDGTPYAQTRQNNAAGLVFSISVASIAKTVLDNLMTQFATALTNDTTVRVTISNGDAGTADVYCLPGFPKFAEYAGEYHADIIADVKFNFVVTARV